MQNQQLTISDFTGGKTDYIYGANPNKYQTADNLVLNRNGQLELRAGLTLYDTANYQIPAGAVRLQTIIPTYNEDFLYFQSSRKIWYITGGSLTEITGPTSNPALGSGDTTNFIDYAEWNKHIYITSDDLCKPSKIYPNASSVPVVRTAGLPALASSPTVTAGAAGANSYIYTFFVLLHLSNRDSYLRRFWTHYTGNLI